MVRGMNAPGRAMTVSEARANFARAAVPGVRYVVGVLIAQLMVMGLDRDAIHQLIDDAIEGGCTDPGAFDAALKITLANAGVELLPDPEVSS